MTPAQAQQHALNELEELGGKPVVLQEDASLPNLARIQIATATRPVHWSTQRISRHGNS
jgi:hypothetical protein